MENIPTKNPGDQYTSTEFNSSNNELKNFIGDASIALDSGQSDQMAKSAVNYVGVGDYFVDSGLVDAYVLSAISPRPAPTDLLDGIRARFLPQNSNIGASTVNFVALGVKPIKKYGRSADLEAGDITAGSNVEIVYSLSDDVWELISVESPIIVESIPLFPSFSEMNMANDTTLPDTHIEVAPGTFKNKNSADAFTLDGALIKDLSQVWAAGNNNGGRASAISYTINTWYHFFVIAKADGTVDAGFDTDVNATNLLADTASAGFTFWRRRGSVFNLTGNIIRAFKNLGTQFINVANPPQSTSFVPPTEPSFSTLDIGTPIDVFTLATCACEIVGVANNSTQFMLWKPTFATAQGGIVIYANTSGGDDFNAANWIQITADTNGEVDIQRQSAVVATYGFLTNRYVELEL